MLLASSFGGKMLKILICDGLDEIGLKILRSAEGVEADMPDGLERIKSRPFCPGTTP